MKNNILTTKKNISLYINRIWDRMVRSTNESEVFFIPFGYLLVIGYLGFYYFNLFFAEPSGYENIRMRIIVAIMGVSLITKNYWIKYIKHYIK